MTLKTKKRPCRRAGMGIVAAAAAVFGLFVFPAAAHAEVIAADGAVGVNAAWEAGKSHDWYVELQRTGADEIDSGLKEKNPASVQKGLKIFNWAWAHQAADGSFPGTAGGKVGQEFHSTSLFVEAAARATAELQQQAPVTYAAAISVNKERLQAAADWLTTPEVAEAGQAYNRRFTHRRYLLAAALAETAVVTGDTSLLEAAEPYVLDGLSLQKPTGWRAALTQYPNGDIPPAVLVAPGQGAPEGTKAVISAAGVNPEDGGYDVSYNAVGVEFAERYYWICPDPELRADVAAMIDRAMRWEASRMDSDGYLLTAGSTRVGIERNRDGSVKHLNPDSVRWEFTQGYLITQDQVLREAALALR